MAVSEKYFNLGLEEAVWYMQYLFLFLGMASIKLDGVGPVDNRPSTD